MKFWLKKLLQASFIIYMLLLIVNSIHTLFYIITSDNYTLHAVGSYNSDWLINYEGGFVRRGLVGQIMLWIYNLIPYDVALTTIIVTYLSIYLLTALMFYLFYKNKISWLLLPAVFLVGGFLLYDATIYRRDALMLLMVFYTIYLYRRYLSATTQRVCKLLGMYIIGTITILTHEASFFCFTPFFLLHYYTTIDTKSTCKRIAKSTLFNLPFLMAMALVCLFNGNMEISQKIWNSWAPYFISQLGTIPNMGWGVNALSWDTADTFSMHFYINYIKPILWDREFLISTMPQIPNVFVWIIIFAAVYYLCVNVNKIKLFTYENGENDTQINAILPQILLIQFIALLHMFTVLSCDMRRVIFYWIFSSFFILSQLIPIRQQLSLPIITPTSNYLYNIFTNKRVLRNKLFYVFTLLVIGIPFGAITVNEYINSTIIFRIKHIITSMIAG